MDQPTLIWDTTVRLPVTGRTVAARHAGSTGAHQAARDRGALVVAYLRLLDECGPLSDDEAARMLGRRLSAINSTRNACGGQVVPSGTYESVTWPGGHTTKRVRWMRVREAA